MDTHENQCGLNADTPERALDDAAESLPEEELLYDLADLFKVFSDTTRIKILYALMNDEKSVNEIAENLGASQSAVSHQLRILKQAHLVKFRRDGRNIHYSLADDHVLTILDQGLTHICEYPPPQCRDCPYIEAPRANAHPGGLDRLPNQPKGPHHA